MPTDPCVDLQTTHGDTIVATIHQATNPHGLPIQHHDTRRTTLDCHKPGPMRQHCQRRAGHTELRHTSWGKTDDDTVF